MSIFISFILGALTLALSVIFSVFYFVIKKYTETLAKLSAEDYYKSRMK